MAGGGYTRRKVSGDGSELVKLDINEGVNMSRKTRTTTIGIESRTRMLYQPRDLRTVPSVGLDVGN